MAYRCPIDNKKFEKYKEQTEDLKSGLQNILTVFNGQTEWSDIERSLQKILLHFKTTDTPFIFDKAALFKRLAQCLNPNIEEGVHETVLNIYEKFFQNLINSGEGVLNDLPFVALGLFNFIPHCSNHKKQMSYTLIDNYFLKAEVNIAPLAPSIIHCLSYGLLENNKDIDTKVYDILERLKAFISTPMFYICIWIILGRTSKIRYGLLKFLDYDILKFNKKQLSVQNEIKEKIKEQKDIINNDLVLTNKHDDIATVEDVSVIVDPEIIERNIKEETREGNVVPEINILNLDILESIGKNVDQTQFENDSDYKNLKTVNDQLNPTQTSDKEIKSLDESDYKIVDQKNTSEITDLSASKIKEPEIVFPSDKIQEHFDQLDNKQTPEIVKDHMVVEETATKREEAIFENNQYNQFLRDCSEQLELLRREVINPNEANPIFFPKNLILNSVINCLNDENDLIKRMTLDLIINHFLSLPGYFDELSWVRILETSLFLLVSGDYSIKRRILGLFFMSHTGSNKIAIKTSELENLVKALRRLFTNFKIQRTIILKILLSLFMENEDLTEYVIEHFAFEIIEIVADLSEEEFNSIGKNFFISIQSYFYILISGYICLSTEQISIKGIKKFYELGKELFEFDEIENRIEDIPESLIKFHSRKGLVNDSVDGMFDNEDEELEIIGNNSVHLLRMKIFEGLLKLINKEGVIEVESFSFLVEILQKWKDLHTVSNTKNFVLSFIQQSKKGLESSEVFEGIDLTFFELSVRVSILLLKKIGDYELTYSWVVVLEQFLYKTSNNNDLCFIAVKGISELILENENESFIGFKKVLLSMIWSLLDDRNFQSSVMILIKNFFSGNSFKDVLDLFRENLKSEDIRSKISSISKLTSIWRLESEIKEKSDYFTFVDSVTLMLIDLLEDPHPVIRQYIKSWLIDINSMFVRVIDPIIISLQQNTSIFTTVNGKIFHTDIFDIDIVLRAIKRMNMIISNDSEFFGAFATQSDTSPYLHLHLKTEETNVRKYADMLIESSLIYIKANVLPFMGRRFRQDNLLIATASSELLEVILKSVMQSDITYIQQSVVESLTGCYYQFVEDKQTIMQLNIINLLKVIFLQNGYIDKNDNSLSLFESLFLDKQLYQQIIESLQNTRNSHTFVKITTFAEVFLEIIIMRFPEEKSKNVIGVTLNKYYELLNLDTFETIKDDCDMILIESSIKILERFLRVDVSTITTKAGNTILRLISLGYYYTEITNTQYPVIEKFLLERFDKILLIIMKGWNCCFHKESFYEIYNIGTNAIERVSADNSSPSVTTRNHLVERTTELKKKKEVTYNLKNLSELQMFTKKLYSKFQNEFFNAIFKIWGGSFTAFNSDLALDPNILRTRIVDVVLQLGISETDIVRKAKETSFYNVEILPLIKKRNQSLMFQDSQNLSSLMSFLYTYLRYIKVSFVPGKMERLNHLRGVWNFYIEFFKEFQKIQNPVLESWIIELYHLLAQVFPVQEIITEYYIKKPLHIHENEILERIVDFICENNFKLTFQRNPSFNTFTFVNPIFPSVVSLCLNSSDQYLQRLVSFYDEEFHLRFYNKIVQLHLLKSVTLNLLKLTYTSQSKEKIAKRIYSLVSRLFVYMENLLKTKIPANEGLYLEILEYIFVLLQDAKDYLLPSLEQLITEFLNSDLFFDCNTKALHKWSFIIDWHLKILGPKLFDKYLEQTNYTSIFGSEGEKNKQRFKSFHRLCFIFYSQYFN
mgnify:FL=1